MIDRDTAGQLIVALYRTLLGRDPDPAGLRNHVGCILDQGESIEKTIERFLRSEEFASAHSYLIGRYIHEDARRFTNDVSQYGETEILLKGMVNAFARHRIIVDVGARGKERSNSFDLLKYFGWHGLLIEANPHLISELENDFAGLNKTIVNRAVSDYVGKATFYLGENLDVSSLTRQFVEVWGLCSGSVEVEVNRLGAILHEHAIPSDFDVLSLDLEGEDVKV